MDDPALISRLEDRILKVRLNRPSKRNALTREILTELKNVLSEHAAREEVRLVVLEGSGAVFCAGMDLSEMQETAAASNPEELWAKDAELYAETMIALLKFPTPTLVVVNGPVLAGGVGLVLACDLVLGSETASFSLPEPQRGIVAAVVTPLLHYRIGTGGASWMLLSQTPCSVQQCAAWGLVQQVVPAGELESAKGALITAILKGSPGALAQTKEHLFRVAGAGLVEEIRGAAKLSGAARKSSEAREGLAAFLEKRVPRWD